jgi:hypothetical protein
MPHVPYISPEIAAVILIMKLILQAIVDFANKDKTFLGGALGTLMLYVY